MADTLTVANRFLTLAEANGDSLTPMQLLKLVYLAHGWMLGLYGIPLIRDEIQAWQYGPVIPRLYNAIRHYRERPVENLIQGAKEEGLTRREESVVEQVYDIYGGLSGPALSRLTHAHGTPWAMTYRDGRHGIIIPGDVIEDHYQRLARKRQDIA